MTRRWCGGSQRHDLACIGVTFHRVEATSARESRLVPHGPRCGLEQAPVVVLLRNALLQERLEVAGRSSLC
jgi:hypothetical protein